MCVVDGEDLIESRQVRKGEAIYVPQAPEKEGYRFSGYYLDREFKTEYTVDTIFTEDTDIYLKYDERLERDGFLYYITDDDKAEICGCNDTFDWIPVSLDGHEVVKISDGAFAGCSQLTDILIPDTLTEIGAGAFDGCRSLKTIHFVGSEEQWNAIALGKNNDALNTAEKEFNYREGIVSGRFGELSFADGAINGSIDFRYVYKDCIAVIEIRNDDDELEKTVEIEIPKAAVQKEFSIPFDADDMYHYISVLFADNTVDRTELGDGYGDEFYAERVCYTEGDYTYAVVGRNAEIVSYSGEATEITVPNTIGGYTVTRIGGNAFGDSGITGISLPSSLTYIGDGAFRGTEIASILIPTAVTKIGKYVFDYCHSLENIEVDGANANYCSVDGNLYSKDKTELIRYAIGKTETEWAIPGTVTTIKDFALADSSLSRSTIPDSVTTIGKYALSGGAWSRISIPASVTDMGEMALTFCGKLTEIDVVENNKNYCSDNGVLFNKDKSVLMQYPAGKGNTFYKVPDGVSVISKEAFAGSALQTVVLPISLNMIEPQAFVSCDSLKNVLYPGTESEFNNISFGYENDIIQSANITFNYDGTPARIDTLKCWYDSGKLTAKVNFGYIMQDGKLYIAIYDGNKMIAVKEKPITLGNPGSVINMEADGGYKNYTARAFLWDNGSLLKPIAEAAQSGISEAVFIDFVLESEHNYADNTDETKSYTYDGDCESIDVTFSDDTETENNFDFIYILDAEDNQIGKYSGTELAGQTVNVKGNTVKIRLISDSVYNGYGYKTESIIVNK